jgi:purine-binding chemotaxis protein CheW
MSEITVLTEELKLIVFQLVDKEYAIPVNQVRSIEKLQYITRVPKTPPYVKGVINLRGVVTPIIDLRSKFDLTPAEPSDGTRVIIAGLQDKEVGLIVDAANDVLDVSRDSIEPPPEVVGVVEAEYIGGVVKQDRRLLILLQLDKILQSL